MDNLDISSTAESELIVEAGIATQAVIATDAVEEESEPVDESATSPNESDADSAPHSIN